MEIPPWAETRLEFTPLVNISIREGGHLGSGDSLLEGFPPDYWLCDLLRVHPK